MFSPDAIRKFNRALSIVKQRTAAVEKIEEIGKVAPQFKGLGEKLRSMLDYASMLATTALLVQDQANGA